MKRIWILVLVMGLVAAACGGGGDVADDTTTTADGGETTTTEAVDDETTTTTEEAPEATTIRYFTFSAAPDNLEVLDEMIAAFEAENPDVTVEVETAPFDEYFSVLQTQIAGGDAPDAFETNYESFVSFAANGTLADLGPMMEADSEFDSEAYYGPAFDAFSHEGVQYGLPESYSTVMLFYNEALFDEAGIDYPTGDWTWEDERAAAEEIAALGGDGYAYFSPIQFHEFYKTAAQNGCSFFTDGEVTLNEPECVEAVEYMLSYVEDGLQPTAAEMGGVSDGDMFLNGELGMLTTGIWMFGAFADAPFEWDVVVEPGNTQGGSHFFANAVAVSSSSENQEAAYRWIRFFTSNPQAAELRVDAAWELPTLTDTSLYESYLSQTPPENRQAVLDSLENVVVPPTIERQAEMQDAISALLEQAVAGELTAQEALNQAAEEVASLLE